MKILFKTLTVSLIALSLCACGGGVPSEKTPDVEVVQDVSDDNVAEGAVVQDGIEFAITGCTIEPYEDSNGKYDRRIVLTYKMKNTTDKAHGYSSAAWDGKMSDGYKLESWVNMSSMQLTQVASNSEKEEKAYFLVEPGMEVTEFVATYQFMEYSEEYWNDIGKAITGEVTESEFMKKYGNPKSLDFNVVIDE